MSTIVGASHLRRLVLLAVWGIAQTHGAYAQDDNKVSQRTSDFAIRTLVCNYSKGKVYEIDTAEKVLWEARVPYAWGCCVLPNGNRLCASYAKRSVTEFNRKGEEVWSITKLPGAPFNVARLENGNTLTPCGDSNKVVEISPDKETVWEVELAGRPMDAQRLPNGRTLVALQKAGKVVEVNRDGEVVWEVSGQKGAISASRLENGNTLICRQAEGKVVEVRADGEVVWSQEDLRNPYDAQRLPNGSTLIVDFSGLREFDRKGEIVWKHEAKGISRIHRYW